MRAALFCIMHIVYNILTAGKSDRQSCRQPLTAGHHARRLRREEGAQLFRVQALAPAAFDDAVQQFALTFGVHDGQAGIPFALRDLLHQGQPLPHEAQQTVEVRQVVARRDGHVHRIELDQPVATHLVLHPALKGPAVEDVPADRAVSGEEVPVVAGDIQSTGPGRAADAHERPAHLFMGPD